MADDLLQPSAFPPELHQQGSQDTLASLVQLDPMPEVAEEKKERLVAPAGALGLSSGHGTVYYLSRVQRYSSYAFAIFSSVHLVTTSLVPLATRSVSSSESYLLLAREIYQTKVSEPLLVFVPIAAHVGAGVALRLVRRSQNLKRYGRAAARQPGSSWPTLSSGLSSLRSGWPSLSVISSSGYAFFFALSGHIIVNRFLPLAVEGDSADIGLAYIAHGFWRHPVTAWLSYTFFLGVASGHMVWGWARWLTIAQRASWSWKGTSSSGNAAADKAIKRRKRRTWLFVQGGVLAAFIAWAAGGLGVVARGGRMRGWVGDVYDGLYDVARL